MTKSLRVVATLISGVMLSVGLAACGSDDDETSDTAAPAATSATTAATPSGSATTAPSSGSATTAAALNCGTAPLKIKLGVPVTLSGPAASVGIAHDKSLQVAKDMINAAPAKYLGCANRSIEFDIREAGTEVATAATFAREFAADSSYHGILGPSTSPQALSLNSFAQQSKIPLVIPFSPAPGLTDPGNFVFKIATSNDVVNAAVIPKVAPAKAIKKAGVIWNDDNQANVLAGESALAEFKKLNIPTETATLPFTSNDYSAAITKLKNAGVDAVYISTSSGGIAAAVVQAERENFRPMWLGQAQFTDKAVIEGAGKTLAGRAFFGSDFPAADSPLVKEFSDKYRAAAGTDAIVFSAYGVTSALVVAAAVKTLPGDKITRDQLADALSKLKDVDVPLGATGKLSMDAKRQAVITPRVFTYGPDGLITPFS